MLTRKRALVSDKAQDKDDKTGLHDEGDTAAASTALQLPVHQQQPSILPLLSIAEQTKRSPATQKRSFLDGSCNRPRSKRQRRDTGAPNKPGEVWTDDDKDVFFQALQEFGKDFDKIHKYIVQKVKNRADAENKTRDQVRHFYYRTWRWLEKYVQFGDGVDKAAAELFGLINYSELRKKLGSKNSMNGKNAEKLRELIHNGSTTIKVCGKKLRLKTPTCRALKKLFKIADDKISCDKVKVPEFLFIDLQPRDAYSWTSVHMMAHNPNLRVKVKSKQTLSRLLDLLQRKWVPHRVRLRQQFKEVEVPQELRVFPLASAKLKDYALKAVKPCTAKRVDLNVDSYLSTVVGKAKSEDQLCASELPVNGILNDTDAATSITSRTAVGGLATNDLAMGAAVAASALTSALSGLYFRAGELVGGHAVQENRPQSTSAAPVVSSWSSVGEQVPAPTVEKVGTTCGQAASVALGMEGDGLPSVGGGSGDDAYFEQIKELARNGWTYDTCGGITIGELYLLIGSSEKVILEYSWQASGSSCKTSDEPTVPKTDALSSLRKLSHLARSETTDITRKTSMSPSVNKDTSSPTTRQRGRVLRPAASAGSAVAAVPSMSTSGATTMVTLPAGLTSGGAATVTSTGFVDVLPSLPVQAVQLGSHTNAVGTMDGVFRIPRGPDSMSSRTVSINPFTKVPMVTNRNARNKIVRKPLLVQRTLLPSSQGVLCLVPCQPPPGGASSMPASAAGAGALHATMSARPLDSVTDVLSAAMKASGVSPMTTGAIASGAADGAARVACQSSLLGSDSMRADAETAAADSVMLPTITEPSSSGLAHGSGGEKRRIVPVPVVTAMDPLLTPFALAACSQPAPTSGDQPLTSVSSSQELILSREFVGTGGTSSSHVQVSLPHLDSGANRHAVLSFTGLIDHNPNVKPSAVSLDHRPASEPSTKEWLTPDVSLGEFSLSSLLASAAEKSPEKHLLEPSAVALPTVLDDSSRLSFLSKFDVLPDVTDITVDNALNTLMTENTIDFMSKFDDLSNQLDTPRKRPAEN